MAFVSFVWTSSLNAFLFDATGFFRAMSMKATLITSDISFDFFAIATISNLAFLVPLKKDTYISNVVIALKFCRFESQCIREDELSWVTSYSTGFDCSHGTDVCIYYLSETNINLYKCYMPLLTRVRASEIKMCMNTISGLFHQCVVFILNWCNRILYTLASLCLITTNYSGICVTCIMASLDKVWILQMKTQFVVVVTKDT